MSKKAGSMMSFAASPFLTRPKLHERSCFEFHQSPRIESLFPLFWRDGSYLDHRETRAGRLLRVAYRLCFYRNLFAPDRVLHFYGRRIFWPRPGELGTFLCLASLALSLFGP